MTKKLSVSSRHVQQHQKKPEDILLTAKMEKELLALKKRQVNLSDKNSPEITDWINEVVGKSYRPIKKQITVRIDMDVLDWFKHAAKQYQTLINKVCRDYMKQHTKRAH